MRVPVNRDRFLAGIAERVAPDRVQALYLFPPLRQGPLETGVAVLAVDPMVADGEAADARHRPVVLTARYRHTQKGADRGKWELDVVEQADAPLATVDMVVQGVQDRLDDGLEPERLTADALRDAQRMTQAEGAWTPPAR